MLAQAEYPAFDPFLPRLAVPGVVAYRTSGRSQQHGVSPVDTAQGLVGQWRSVAVKSVAAEGQVLLLEAEAVTGRGGTQYLEGSARNFRTDEVAGQYGQAVCLTHQTGLSAGGSQVRKLFLESSGSRIRFEQFSDRIPAAADQGA